MSKIRRTLAFSAADTYFGLPLQVLSTMLLSRLLSPAEMGVFAVAAVFSAFASTFRDFGVAEYLIQERDLSHTRLRAALTVNITLSWLIGLALFIAAPFAADFYRHPGVASVMRIQSINFLLIPFGAVTLAWFRRELDYRPIFTAGALANIVTFAVSVGCALAGQGYMSLAWSSLAGVITTVATAMWFRPRGFPLWPGFRELRPVFQFGRFASGVYLFGQIGRGMPEMMIGRAQGLADVAMFSRGGGLVELFNRVVLRVVMPVCQPYFARDHRELGTVLRGYRFGMAFLTAVGWPVLLFLALASYSALHVLYGSQWTAAAPLAKILCAAAAIDLVHMLSLEALLAVGEARRANNLQLRSQLIRIVGLTAVFVWGTTGAAWGVLGASAVAFLVSQLGLREAVGLRWSDVAGTCGQSLIVVILAGVPVALMYALVPQTERNFVSWLLAGVAVAAISWLSALRTLRHPVWVELMQITTQVVGRMRPGRVAPTGDPGISRLEREIVETLGHGRLQLERAVSVRDNSIVYRARLGKQIDAAHAAIKCCRLPGSDRIDEPVARSQFEALRRVHDAFAAAAPRYTVPEPLWFEPRLAAYAMQWVEGESLTDRLGGYDPMPQMETAFEAAGAWLGAFHRAGPVHVGATRFEAQTRHVEAMRSTAVDHPIFAAGLSTLTDTLSEARSNAIHISWLHGDCKTDNFLMTSAGVCGIDIALSHENAVEHDLAQFLNQVELLTSGWRFVHRRGMRLVLTRAFLRGYRRTGPPIHEPFLRWIRLWSALTLWHTRVAEGGALTPERWILNRAFAHLARGLQLSLRSLKPA